MQFVIPLLERLKTGERIFKKPRIGSLSLEPNACQKKVPSFQKKEGTNLKEAGMKIYDF